jgi:nicotinamidase-related amidase
MSAVLRPLPANALHVAIDVQRLFAEHAEWGVPSLPSIMPNLLRLSRHRPAQTVFTRFVPPAAPEHSAGVWRRYYERWSSVTLDRMPHGMIDLVPELMTFVPPAEVVDKGTYSAYGSESFGAALRRRGADTLVFSGLETDVCVMASIFETVDRGLRTVVVSDAVTSASARGHEGALAILESRFHEQVELASTDDVIAAWGD